MIQIGNRLYIPTTHGVNIIIYGDSLKKVFVNNNIFTGDRLDNVLGLDKPKNRVKAICK
jgi:hypothetical protein